MDNQMNQSTMQNSTQFDVKNKHKFMNQSNLENSTKYDIRIKDQESQNKIHGRRYKSLTNLILINLTYSIGNMFFGYSIVYLGTVDYSLVNSIYNIPLEPSIATGLLVGCIPIGAFIGSVFTNKLINATSRRRGYFIANFLALLFTFLIYIPNFYTLVFMRIGQAIAVGIFTTIIPILIKQINPTEMVGRFSFLPAFFFSLGIFLSFLLGYILAQATRNYNGQHIWIYCFGYPIIIILIQSFILLFIYDFQTPQYYIKNGQFQDAKKLIQYLYKPQHVDQVFRQKLIECHMRVPNLQHSHNNNTYTDLTIIDNPYNPQWNNGIKQKGQKQQIKCPKKARFMAYQFGVLQQFAGLGVVVIYSIQLISYIQPNIKHIIPIVITFEMALFSLLFPLLIKKLGRRPILLYGCIISIIGTLLIGVGYSIINKDIQASKILVLLGIFIFIGNFMLTVNPITAVLISQIVQGRRVTQTIALSWVAAFIIVFLFPILTKHAFYNNPAPFFYFFSVWVLISLILNYKYTVQTKEKTSQQIRRQYQKI